MRLKDKVAVISGAAAGMGAATARLFAREGARVFMGDIVEADGHKVATDINAEGGAARFQRLDVTSEADWKGTIQAALSAWGRLDILINNAGVSGSDPDLFSMAVWDTQMSVNAKGVFLGMRTAIPVMQQAGRGSIVNISSISGLVGQSVVHMGYNAAKGAVRMMSKAAAVQFAKNGIRVNSVHPGIMPPMRTSKMTANPEVRKSLLAGVPMGREGRIEEVAYANLFLASDEASYITGVELPVDGGFVAV